MQIVKYVPTTSLRTYHSRKKTIKILALLNTAPPSEKYGTAYFCNFDEIIWLLKCDSYADF